MGYSNKEENPGGCAQGGVEMNISLFDVLGPVMIGPSSSHTAGAAKLARVARIIAERPFHRVRFGLYGSFAKTGLGHGTRQALLAGAMGLSEDDERLRDAQALAEAAGICYEFYEVELDGAHENTAVITFNCDDGSTVEVIGCSVGGGRIKITEIDGLAANIRAESPTLLITQNDRPGVVGAVSGALAESGLNIAIMRVSRETKGDIANCVIETDGKIETDLVERIRRLPNIRSVRAINI